VRAGFLMVWCVDVFFDDKTFTLTLDPRFRGGYEDSRNCVP